MILPKFRGWSFVLLGISRGTEKNKKNCRILIKKVCPQTRPVCCFSWSSPFRNNWVELVPWGTCLERSIDFMSRWSICVIFMCSIISIGFKKVHTSVLWYRLIGERSTPAWEVKPPFSPTLSIYISAVNICRRQGKIQSLTAFYKLFLSDTKVKMCCLSPFVWLISSVFIKWKALREYTYWAGFTDVGSVVLQF